MPRVIHKTPFHSHFVIKRMDKRINKFKSSFGFIPLSSAALLSYHPRPDREDPCPRVWIPAYARNDRRRIDTPQVAAGSLHFGITEIFKAFGAELPAGSESKSEPYFLSHAERGKPFWILNSAGGIP